MAALRTQIYLQPEQRDALDRLVESEGASLAELIREAVDEYLERHPGDIDAVLDECYGAAPDAAAAPRSEWARRERAVGAV